MHIDWLDEIEGPRRYGYVTENGEGAGSLVVEDADGNTMLSPHPGRFCVLEEAESRADALERAREWARSA